jgi:hypothetical protein
MENNKWQIEKGAKVMATEKIERAVFAVVIGLFISGPVWAAYGGGSGTAGEPYLINTPAQMNTIGLNQGDWDKHFKLMADIDMSTYMGTSYNIIGNSTTKFTGVLDGNDHTISNFTYTSISTDCIGLFGYLYGEIKNLGLINPSIDAGTGEEVGTLAGRLVGDVFGCYVEGGSVAADANVGALVGWNRYGSIVSNCYATATVSGTSCVGGLVGINDYKVLDSYTRGGVSGTTDVGGLVGRSSAWGTISDCYSTGSVSGTSNVGGLVGFSEAGGVIENSFWDIEVGGPDNGFGTPLTTAQMQNPNTFLDAGWDFVGETQNGLSDVWAEPDGGGYMILWYQLSSLPPLPGFSGGSGTAEDPYLISTANELNSIGCNPRLMSWRRSVCICRYF